MLEITYPAEYRLHSMKHALSLEGTLYDYYHRWP